VNTCGESKQTDKTSSTILVYEFASFVESSLDACCLFQQSFLRFPDLPQDQHFPLPLISFDLDLIVPLLSFPPSIDRPWTTISSIVEVYLLDLFIISSNKKMLHYVVIDVK
jgi:hypothetical protein